VTLVGVPGIGKSRLVSELLADVEQGPDITYWRQGRSLPYGDGVTFWALSEMVKAQAGVLEDDDPGTAAEKLGRAIRDLIADEAEAEWVERYVRPLVAASAEAVPADNRRTEAFAAWRRFFEAIAEVQPLVLVFEDLHWADDALLDFVDHLAGWASGVPLLVLAMARPELLDRRAGWGGGKPNAVTLSLSPLSDEETARIVSGVLERSVLPAETQQTLLVRAGGNPLYAEQYAHMLAERGEIEGDVPETVHGIIAARLDLLSAEEKRLLQDAAVIGKTFWVGALAAMTGLERWSLEERMHALERREFVQRARRSSLSGETELLFRHVLVRDVAYGQIPRAVRAEKHRRAAEWIETLARPDAHAEMLAHHHSAALEYAEAAGAASDELRERARLALRGAGDRALALNAFAASARFYGRALELWPAEDRERPHLLLAYGKALHIAEAGGDEALSEAAAALARVGEAGLAAEAEALLADLAVERRHSEQAERHLERAFAHAAHAEDSSAKAYVFSSASRHMALTGAADAMRVSLETLALAERLGLQEIRARTLTNIGLVHMAEGRGDHAVAMWEQAMELSRRINAPRELLRAVNNLDAYQSFYGDAASAIQLAAQVRELAARYGDSFFASQAKFQEGRDLYWLGRWGDALSVFDAHLQAPDVYGHEVWDLVFRAKCLLARGENARAARDAERIDALARAASEPQSRYFSGTAARLFAELGCAGEAGAAADAVLADWRERQFMPSWWALDLALALAILGRGDDLLELAHTAHTRTRWLETAELYATGDYARAADVLALIGSRPDEAYVRMKAGGEHIAPALEFWRSVGATRYVQEAEALRAATA
jgi:hypothetical protein